MTMAGAKDQAPLSLDGARLTQDAIVARCQRPKNSHNKRITGIGTPKSQSRSPRPIFASIIRSILELGKRGEVPASRMEKPGDSIGTGRLGSCLNTSSQYLTWTEHSPTASRGFGGL